MSDALNDGAAIEFAVAFYDAIGSGETIEFAYKLACNAIQWTETSEYLKPQLVSTKAPLSQGSLPRQPKSSGFQNGNIDNDIKSDKESIKKFSRWLLEIPYALATLLLVAVFLFEKPVFAWLFGMLMISQIAIVFIGSIIVSFGMSIHNHYQYLEFHCLIDLSTWGGYEHYLKICRMWGKVNKFLHIRQLYYYTIKLFIGWYRDGKETWKELYFGTDPSEIDLEDVNAIYEWGKLKDMEGNYRLSIAAYAKVMQYIENHPGAYHPELVQVYAEAASVVQKMFDNPQIKQSFFRREIMLSEVREAFKLREKMVLNSTEELSSSSKVYCSVLNSEVSIEIDQQGEYLSIEGKTGLRFFVTRS